LRESERRYQTLFDSIFEAFCVIERITTAPGELVDFRYITANPTFVTQTGIGDVVGRTLREVLPGESQEWCDTYDNVLQTGQPIRFERELVAQGRTLELFAFPCGEKDRPMVGVTFSDITLRKRAAAVELALQQSEKLAAVGRLASSIAHEINNPLEAMTNLLYLALDDDQLAGNTRGYLQTAEQELRRIVQITAQTLRFHRNTITPVATSGREIVDSVLALYEGRLNSSGITVEQDIKENAQFSCYAGELRQVLVNLVANAFDVMRDGGKLLMRARLATDWKSGAKGIRFTVADSGIGMSAGTQARLFKPFFTTKEDTGTGLGLWLSKGIIAKHKGSLTVRSRQAPGPHGTVFAVFLVDLSCPEI